MTRARIAAAAAAAVLAAGGVTAAAASTHVPPPARHPRCASVLLSQQTATGHEADLPVELCGGMRRGSWQCFVSPWGPLTANSKLVCHRQ